MTALFVCGICLRTQDSEEHLAILDEEFCRLYRRNISDVPPEHICDSCYEAVLDRIAVPAEEWVS